MNKYVVFEVNVESYQYFEKLIIKYNIEILNSKLYKNKYKIKCSLDSYNIIKKHDYKNKLSVPSYTGLIKYISFIKNNYLKVILTLVIIIIIFVSKYMIFNININTNNISIKKKIYYYLQDQGISEISIIKSTKKINNIKRKILNKYNDEISWLEISKKGYYLNIDLIEKKKPNINSNNQRCHYVAKKSGTVKNIRVKKGVLNTSENVYVNKDDILISGDVIYNEEVKTSVCANGTISGEVWYVVSVSMPKKNIVNTKSKKGQLNIKFNLFNKNYKLFKSKYNNVLNSSVIKLENSIFGFELYKENLIKSKKEQLTDAELENKAIKIGKEKLLKKTGKKSKIVDQNILKKSINNSTIYIEVLFTVEEELGMVLVY